MVKWPGVAQDADEEGQGHVAPAQFGHDGARGHGDRPVAIMQTPMTSSGAVP